MANISPIKGQNKVLFFQGMDDIETDGNKLRLAFQTEHSLSQERELIEESTKDGVLKEMSSNVNSSIDLTAYFAKNDTTAQLLQDAFENNKTLQIWEVDLTPTEVENSYDALYAQGSLENLEQSNGTEGYSEFSTTFQINLTPQKGRVELSPQSVADIQYAFNLFGQLGGPVNP